MNLLPRETRDRTILVYYKFPNIRIDTVLGSELNFK